MSSTLRLNKTTKAQIDSECFRIFDTGLMDFPISNKEEAKQMIQLLRKRGITYISMFVALGIPDSTFRSWRNDTGNKNDKKKVEVTNQVIHFLNQRYQENFIAQQNESDSESRDSDDGEGNNEGNGRTESDNSSADGENCKKTSRN